MSFDLMLLDPETVPTAEQIYEILESDEAEVPLSARMRAVIEINIQWDYATAMLPALIEIAARQGIVLFDPQASMVHLPERLA